MNSIAFDDEGKLLYSGDGLGAIRVWNTPATDLPSTKGVARDWTHNREIMDGEIKVSVKDCQCFKKFMIFLHISPLYGPSGRLLNCYHFDRHIGILEHDCQAWSARCKSRPTTKLEF